MADQFVAEIRMFGFNFAPSGWAQCNGQLLPLAQNTALFSLLGTTYGGDGKSTFALPDLQGSVPVGAGQGPGLSLYDLGQIGGSATVTLLESEIPFHSHQVNASTTPLGGVATPSATVGYTRPASGNAYGAAGSATTMAPQALTPAGGGLPHNNLQPYNVVNYCIALQGIFPPHP
ncbi:MAG TPA: tail fiber protein [Kofleriaceae bacterium]|nr:tail fiber protein [Kofleriaceae bacterium]